VLLAKQEWHEQEEIDIDDVIEQLKKEKQYLFRDSGGNVTSTKTSGAKDARTMFIQFLPKRLGRRRIPAQEKICRSI